MAASRPLRGGPATCLACLALLAPVASEAQSAAVNPLPLTSVLERALTQNRAIAAARLQRPVTSAALGVARERLNPELSFEISKETPRQSYLGMLPIELGSKRPRRISLAEARVGTTEAEIDRLVADVRADVRLAYFDVVGADQRVSVAEDVVALVTRARDAARARLAVGDVPQADLTQAELLLFGAENELLHARGEAAAFRAELNALLNQAADTPLALADSLDIGVLPPSADVLARAMSNNPELRLDDRRIAEQTARREVARSLRVPDVAAGGGLTANAEPEFRYGWRVNVAMAVPVFTTHRAGVLVEEAELARLQADRDATAMRVQGAVMAALARAAAARERLSQYHSEIQPRSADAERQAQVAYSSGQIDLAALVQALRIARESRYIGLQAGIDYQQALSDLERAVGGELR